MNEDNRVAPGRAELEAQVAAMAARKLSNVCSRHL
jgi:hypothetical protein